MTPFLWTLVLLSLFPVTLWRLRRDLHMLQLSGYRPDRYIRWVRKNLSYLLPVKEAYPLWFLVGWWLDRPGVATATWVTVQLLLWAGRPFSREKKPLVWTPRVYRLAAGMLVLLATGIGITLACPHPAGRIVSLTLLQAGSFVLATMAAFLMQPVELHIQRGFLKQAENRLREIPGLLRIGITGSYGKTSAKTFLATLFDETRNTLASPASYNTPMGICRVVNEQLKPIHEVFIAEMGARQQGDIRELCDLVHPETGLITAIGEQHLETFGSPETIRQTKWELAQSLPAHGLLVANLDQPRIRESIERNPPACRVYTYSIQDPSADYRAEEIRFTSAGSRFVLRGNKAQDLVLETPLLGRPNVENLLGAAALALELGLDPSALRRAARRLRPPPHRLERKAGPKGSVLLDDAFNSNPLGAAAALEVLGQMPCKRKFLITPGMVELGGREEECNRAFGAQAAAVCDRILLVGKRVSSAVGDGAKDAGFDPAMISVHPDFFAAYARLEQEITSDDCVLFENDLPDNYLT